MTALFGRVWVFPDASGNSDGQVFMDIGPRVIAGGESGLFGMVFHPNFAENGYFYLSYTTPDPLRSRISRFQVDPANPNRGLADSETVIFEVEQPDPRHNAGQIQFGPDGYLYYSLGDGGIPNDPAFPAQDLTNLFGSLLRIDVDNPGEGMTYGIPESNPFAGNAEGYREEIFSYGLRNTWRFSIDHHEGVTRIWGSDVGASRVEEVNLLVAGGNYGWSVVEGELCFDPRVDCIVEEEFIPPLWSYDHDGSGASITGGYVYRGEAIPELFGDFIYGDYITGEIWALTYDGVNPPSNRLILSIPRQSLTAFGRDAQGELYVLTVSGEVYRIE
jgi:glucose/arabinose dehydrogenase